MQGEIETFVRKVVEPSAKKIIESGQEHLPMVFIQTEKGWGASTIDFQSQEDKINFREKLKKAVKEYDSEYYIFISEAWAITRKRLTKRTLAPSKAKDRQEILNIFVNTRKGKIISYMAEIKGKGKNRKLGKLKKSKANKSESLFKIEW